MRVSPITRTQTVRDRNSCPRCGGQLKISTVGCCKNRRKVFKCTMCGYFKEEHLKPR